MPFRGIFQALAAGSLVGFAVPSWSQESPAEARISDLQVHCSHQIAAYLRTLPPPRNGGTPDYDLTARSMLSFPPDRAKLELMRDGIARVIANGPVTAFEPMFQCAVVRSIAQMNGAPLSPRPQRPKPVSEARGPDGSKPTPLEIKGRGPYDDRKSPDRYWTKGTVETHGRLCDRFACPRGWFTIKMRATDAYGLRQSGATVDANEFGFPEPMTVQTRILGAEITEQSDLYHCVVTSTKPGVEPEERTMNIAFAQPVVGVSCTITAAGIQAYEDAKRDKVASDALLERPRP